MTTKRQSTRTIIPASMAQVAIWESNVFGAIAHQARCLVPGCTWRSTTVDARKDGKPNKAVLNLGSKHAATHTDAQDALDAKEKTSE